MTTISSGIPRTPPTQSNKNSEKSVAAEFMSKPVLLSNTIQALQLLTLIIGLIVVSANIGAKGEKLERHEVDLKELKAITTELVKAQISMSKDTESQGKTVGKLEGLEDRVRKLEMKK